MYLRPVTSDKLLLLGKAHDYGFEVVPLVYNLASASDYNRRDQTPSTD